ncbi:MAG: histidinol dehydrogenase [Bacteroidota bacterium]
MRFYNNPVKEEWPEIMKRPGFDTYELRDKVQEILDHVKSEGDQAVMEFTQRFDGVKLSSTEVSKEEFNQAEKSCPQELKKAIQVAKNNIEAFHKVQFEEKKVMETMPGVKCWRKCSPIQKVGLYVPGGSAPLFSTVLMLAIPAQIAGCSEIVITTPPQKDGSIHHAVLYAAKLCGVTKVVKAGGVQAIAAMAYGTETVPGVYKIFGPGNQYVTMAKQLVSFENTAIDMPAGPSEVAVIADDQVPVSFVASDLLAQAEHGSDSQVLLITTSKKLSEEIEEELDRQLKKLPRAELASKALENSSTVYFDSMDEALRFSNEYAPEHLIISASNNVDLGDRITNAGSVFLGNYTPESAGDYASGTNHSLPTNGYARNYSGVSVDSFIKKITFQKISQEGLKNLGPIVEIMAEAEGLQAHKNAVSIRLEQLNSEG